MSKKPPPDSVDFYIRGRVFHPNGTTYTDVLAYFEDASLDSGLGQIEAVIETTTVDGKPTGHTAIVHEASVEGIDLEVATTLVQAVAEAIYYADDDFDAMEHDPAFTWERS
jgi:hypothetical protein